MLSFNPNPALNNTQINNQSTWTFNSGNEGFHYLSVGQTLTLVYELTINDGEGGLATNEITINITGSNTGPYVTDAISEGEIIEGDPSLISNGFITFRDFDPGDTVSFTGATLQSVEAIEKDGSLRQLSNELINYFAGNLEITETPISNEELRLEWSYEAGSDRIQFMGEGETITLVYLAEAQDQHGNTRSKEIRVIIRGKNNLPEILGGVDTAQVEEGFNGTDEQLNAAGELYIKDLALGGNNQAMMITEIERISFNTNIQNIQAVLPIELGTAADGYQGIKDMLQLSDRLEESQINGEAANAVLEWQFNSGTGGAEAFEFLGSTDNLEIIYDVRIDNTGDAYDTGALEFIGQYTEGDSYIIRINEIEHRYTITANDLTSNGDGSGNNATDEQVQEHLLEKN